MEFKNQNNTVFQLIKTMDRGEKRYFNLFCNRQNSKTGKVYIKLFNAIDKQKKYNYFLLKRKFKNHATQFKLAKAYLYKLVLESLVQYHTKNNLSLHDQLLKINVLNEKGLFKVTRKLICKVRKSAEEQNDYVTALETINIERELLLKSGGLNYSSINTFQKQTDYYISLYKELELYKQMHSKIAFFELKYARMYRDDIKKEKEFKKIAHSTLFKNTNKPRSIISKWLILYTRGMYYIILADYKKANQEYFTAIKTLQCNLNFRKSHPDYVAQTLKGYIVSCIGIKKFDLALQKLSDLKTFCSLYSTIETKRALLSCQNMEQDIYIFTDRKNEAMQLITEVDEKIRKGEIIVDSNKLAFYCNASETCTLFSEYQKSLYWVNKVLNFEFAEKKFPNMYCAARIIQLINLVELQEYDLLFYKMKSFHRYLGKQKLTYRYQEVFVSFIRRILKGEFNKSNLLVLYQDVKKSLINIFKDPEEVRACHFFDFVGWFDSKIKNIPYTTWIKIN